MGKYFEKYFMPQIDENYLKGIEANAEQKIKKADSLEKLEKIRIEFLGRKRGEITLVFDSFKNLSLENKKKIGPLANSLKKTIAEELEQKKKEIEKETENIEEKQADFSRPGERPKIGHLHILSQVEKEIEDIFHSLNFSIIEGPEIEDEFHNFDALNIPKNHPARESWDTFWIKSLPATNKGNSDRLLMRTHTSPVQIRYMESHFPPFKMICPGKVFRHEAIDASHEINFYQVEGLVVDENVNLLNFKYIIEAFLNRFFKRKVEIRFRPSYFPFVEPGVEIDIKLGKKWLEIMGAGMVHPKVFEAVKYNPENWQGFAFGLGLDRMAMIKYKIPDIRLFYGSDLRFIRQFK